MRRPFSIAADLPGAKSSQVSRPVGAPWPVTQSLIDALKDTCLPDSTTTVICLYPDAGLEGSATNPYLGIVRNGLETHGVEVVRWQWGIVLHPPAAVALSWAEYLWLPASSAWGSVRRRVGRAVFVASLRLLRRRGTVVVHIAHNAKPHRWGGSQEEWDNRFAAYFELVDATAFLTESARDHRAFSRLRSKPWCLLPHPHYTLLQALDFKVAGARISRLVFLGGLNARKDARNAIRLSARTLDLEVIVTGSGDATELRERIESDRARPVTLIEGHLQEADLHDLLRPPTAVVLTQRDALNSGVVFLALSRGAVVICPDNATNIELQAEFGTGWVRTFDDVLDEARLAALLEEPIPAELPDLANRAPERVVTGLLKLIDCVRGESR